MLSIEWDKAATLRKNIPTIDVRTPLEYQQGHIPNAHNIPLLNNDDRIAVGTTYKQQGKAAAVKVGFQRIGSGIHQLIDEVERLAQGKHALVYCWRGGLRSSGFCWFMEMAGISTYRLQGGYKSYRTAAHGLFKRPFHVILLAGNTGSGKSDILRALQNKGEQVIDLETMANHKGSVFGGIGMPPQPTTEQFQNHLFEQLLTLDPTQPIWVEDESLAIGKLFIPNDFWATMRQSPIVLCQLPKSTRVSRLVHEYGSIDPTVFQAAMTKIAKKLGNQHFKQATQQLLDRDMLGVMTTLLTYYDKAYEYSLNKRNPKKWHTLYWDGRDPDRAAEELISTIKPKHTVHYE